MDEVVPAKHMRALWESGKRKKTGAQSPPVFNADQVRGQYNKCQLYIYTRCCRVFACRAA